MIEMTEKRALDQEEAALALAWLDKNRDELSEALGATLQKIDPNIIGAACVFGVKLEKAGFVVLGLACGDWSLSTAVHAMENFVPQLRAKLKAEQN